MISIKVNKRGKNNGKIRIFKKIVLVVFILTLSTIGIAETNVIITPKAYK